MLITTVKLAALLVLSAGLLAAQSASDRTPARRFHDSEKQWAVEQTLVRIDPKKNLWVLRNGSDWYLNSVSFECDSSDASDERFVYLPADGAWIAPWEDIKVAKGREKEAPWGFGFPGSDDAVRHLSVGGTRQDVLDVEAAEWYIRSQRVFNCRVIDVELDHKLLKDRGKKIIGG